MCCSNMIKVSALDGSGQYWINGDHVLVVANAQDEEGKPLEGSAIKLVNNDVRHVKEDMKFFDEFFSPADPEAGLVES